MLPEKIKLLGLTYQVQEVDAVSKEEYLFGEINYTEQIIRIDKSLSDERKQQTLLHEVLHGIIEILNLQAEKAESENVVQGIAATLHHIIVSNPTIFS